MHTPDTLVFTLFSGGTKYHPASKLSPGHLKVFGVVPFPASPTPLGLVNFYSSCKSQNASLNTAWGREADLTVIYTYSLYVFHYTLQKCNQMIICIIFHTAFVVQARLWLSGSKLLAFRSAQPTFYKIEWINQRNLRDYPLQILLNVKLGTQ